jgi:hypothetical protein
MGHTEKEWLLENSIKKQVVIASVAWQSVEISQVVNNIASFQRNDGVDLTTFMDKKTTFVDRNQTFVGRKVPPISQLITPDA